MTFLTVTGGIYLALRSAVKRNADRELGIRLQGIRVFLARESSLAPDALADELSSHSGVRLNGDLYQLSTPQGAWIYRPPSVEPLGLSSEPPAQLSAPQFHQIERDGKKYRILSALVSSGTRVYEVQLVSNITPISDAIGTLLWASVFATPVIIAIAWFSGFWLSGRAMRPVRAIIAASQRIRENSLNERLPVSTAHDELRDLALTINSMLDRLEKAFRKITQFTADASHELRTPIAVIRTTTEVALEKHRDAEDYSEFLHQILSESITAAQLLEDMLTLARQDADIENRGISELVDVRALMLGVVPAFTRLAELRHVAFRSSPGHDPLLVRGDKQAIRRLLLILIDNAIKFCSPGGSVRVATRRNEHLTVLEVSDTGPGIDPQDLPHIFERFYRCGSGRSRETGGAGLGLAIAQSIASAHNAEIQVESELRAGTTFRVLFHPVGANRNDELASEGLHAIRTRQRSIHS